MASLIFIMIVYMKDIRCLTVDYSDSFMKLELGKTKIYVSDDTPEDTINLILDLVEISIQENEKLWQKKLGQIILIYCHSAELYNRYGASIASGITRLGTYCVISANGLELDLMSHEFCHVELFNNLERNWWVYYQRLPSWFDEGLALQFNNRGIYSKESLSSINEWTIDELAKIDRPKSFYVKDYEKLISHYLASKKEVARWINNCDYDDFYRIFEGLNRGDDFYEIY